MSLGEPMYGDAKYARMDGPPFVTTGVQPSPQEHQAQVAAFQHRLMEQQLEQQLEQQRVSAKERKVSTALAVLNLYSEYRAMDGELLSTAETVLLDYLKAS